MRKQVVSALMFAFACLSSSGVLAQLTSGDKLPPAIQDIKRASGTCRREDMVGANSSPTNAGGIQADLGCALPVTEIQGLLAQPNSLLVDLRPAMDFQAFHAERAVNLGTNELHSKPYWRNKTLVLVGHGKAEGELYRECAQLKQLGYQQVKVLRGGMPMWLAHHQPVLGSPPSPSQLVRLTAAELWLESQNGHNMLLLDKESESLQRELSGGQVVPKLSPDAIQAALVRYRGNRKAPALAAVVLVTHGVSDEQVGQWQQAVMPVPVLVFSGTKESFVREIGAQKAIWAAHARGPKQPRCGV